MARIIVFLLGGSFALTGIFLFVQPQQFYDTIPGVAMMGPYNVHFIRDAGLAYFASGGALLWGAWKYTRGAAVAGAGFVCLHALFHIQIWIARGMPFDLVAGVNLASIQFTAWLALFAALKLRSAPEGK